MQMSSPEFRIIYPEGEDSLARVYGTWLEKARIGVSRSSGLLAGENYKRRMPVVLHSFNTIPNASVAWAPRRMDFFTAPDAYSPTPVPWEKLLAIHEGRHVSQMNAGVAGRNKVFKYLTGELFAGAFAGLYPGPTLLEGDAVVTETALTSSGRGRQASFLSYMMPAFESGDWRDYWKWSFGSHKYYSPDHYRAGYMLISGTRVFYDDPLFTKEYFDRTSGRGLFFNLQKTVRAASGKSLLRTFRTIEESYASIWAEEAFARGPFMPSNQVTPSPWRHTAYTGSVMAGKSGAWTVRSGLTDSPALVRLDPDGKISTVRPFSTAIGKLNFDKAGERLWWSETIAHPRWTLAGNSRIRFIDLSDGASLARLVKDHPCLVILKAFTKSWGMAGLRLGYCLSSDPDLLAFHGQLVILPLQKNSSCVLTGLPKASLHIRRNHDRTPGLVFRIQTDDFPTLREIFEFMVSDRIVDRSDLAELSDQLYRNVSALRIGIQNIPAKKDKIRCFSPDSLCKTFIFRSEFMTVQI